jgi:anti-sigma factor RsiW
MTSPDIHTLTGAYAVDALEDDERALFELHIRECDACAQEIAELQATAALMGAAAYEAPPASMKAAVMAEVDTVRQERPLPKVEELRPQAAAATAAVVASSATRTTSTTSR